MPAMRPVTVPSSWSKAARAWSGVTGVDEVGHRFRLHEVHAAVQEGAERELARVREPGARPAGEGDHLLEQQRTAVGADLHDVLARVRTRHPGNERRHHPIERGHVVPVTGDEARQRRAARRERSRTVEQRRRPRRRPRPADAHHPQRPAAGRRGDGDDGVVGREHRLSSPEARGRDGGPVPAAAARIPE